VVNTVRKEHLNEASMERHIGTRLEIPKATE